MAGIKITTSISNQGGLPAQLEGLDANIPAAGVTGRLYWATDTNKIYLDNGTAWVLFLQNSTVPGGLTPIGSAGQYLRVNGTATGLEYFTFSSVSVISALGYTPYNSTNPAGYIPLTALSANTPLSYNNLTGAFTIQQASASQAGYLSAADWTTFNNKQSALTNPVTGTGTANSLPKFTGANTIGNSTITDNGTTVATVSKMRLGTAPGSTYQLEVDGGVNIAIGHFFRMNGTQIIPSSTNTLSKTNGAGVLIDSNISDSGTLVTIGAPVYSSSGQLSLGSSPTGQTSFNIQNTIGQSGTAYGIYNNVQFTAASNIVNFNSAGKITSGVTGATFTHFKASQDTYLGTLTNQYGFYADSGLSSATNNYGFYAALSSGYNFYAANTAKNFFGGTTLISSTTDSGSGAVLQANGGVNFLNMFNRQTSNYTLALSDQNKIVEMNVAGANTLTVPANGTIALPVGTEIAIAQYGAGQTTISPAASVTIRSAGGATKIAAQYAMATLVKVATNEWYLVGNITT